MTTPQQPIEEHPLKPFLPSNGQILMLGSFPPQQKRWAIDFYYPNFTNDMWRVFGLVFFNDPMHFVDQTNKTYRRTDIVDFLNSKGIGIYDTACAIRRLQDNASDKFLEIVTSTDINALLAKMPLCRSIVTTGEKAAETICKLNPNGNHVTILCRRRRRQFPSVPAIGGWSDICLVYILKV